MFSSVMSSEVPIKDPYYSSVESLWKFNGSNGSTTILDAKGKSSMLCNGTAAISTDRGPFLPSSGLASNAGTNNFNASTATSGDYAFGTGDFTIEFFYWPISLVAAYLYDQRNANASQAVVGVFCSAGTGLLSLLVTNTLQITTTVGIVAQQWNHIAVCRVSGVTKLFVNGNSSGLSWVDATNYINFAGRPFFMHDGFGGTNQANGYGAELRITHGIGRYPNDFTPPELTFPTL